MENTKPKKLKDSTKFLLAALAIVVLGILLRVFVFTIFRIDTTAMEPSMRSGKYTVACKLMTPGRNSRIVFTTYPDSLSPRGMRSIGRIIGMPGDTVQVVRGKVMINGKAISSPHGVTYQDNYTIAVPVGGRRYKIDPLSLIAYRSAIRKETADIAKGKYKFKSGMLFLDGVRLHDFVFKSDYYWILCDNQAHGKPDSRHIGIIPAQNIESVVLF